MMTDLDPFLSMHLLEQQRFMPLQMMLNQPFQMKLNQPLQMKVNQRQLILDEKLLGRMLQVHNGSSKSLVKLANPCLVV